MLTRLHIRNLAVVDEAELEFGTGFTALTGETGAGKSILVDALALALGARADTSAIRTGAARCEIAAVFDLSARADLVRSLAAEDLDEGEECVLRRVVTREGRSRGYINGRQVALQILRELAPQLVDICGQQSHQSLRHAAVQRDILDQYAGNADLLEQLASAHADWRTASERLETTRAALGDRKARVDLLRYQCGELSALGLRPGEYAEIERRQRRMANSGRIAEGLQNALLALYESDDGTAHAQIASARKLVEELADFDAELGHAQSLLREAEVAIEETVSELRSRSGIVEHDPREQLQLDQRLATTLELARKHGVEPDELPLLHERLSAELDALDRGDETLEELAEQERHAYEVTGKLAKRLSNARGNAARKFGEEITGHMQSLGMPAGEFSVDVSPHPDGRISPRGIDRIEFRVAINPGQGAGPLSRIASGGELSRISLSIQVVALAADSVPTLIFDEVDAGVGGGVAEMVGKRLRELSAERQVLCVTHLPQVASLAHDHFRVAKISDGVDTRTTVDRLDAAARIDEIARMLGGVEITKRTRAHAEEMLGSSKSRKAG